MSDVSGLHVGANAFAQSGLFPMDSMCVIGVMITFSFSAGAQTQEYISHAQA